MSSVTQSTGVSPIFFDGPIPEYVIFMKKREVIIEVDTIEQLCEVEGHSLDVEKRDLLKREAQDNANKIRYEVEILSRSNISLEEFTIQTDEKIQNFKSGMKSYLIGLKQYDSDKVDTTKKMETVKKSIIEMKIEPMSFSEDEIIIDGIPPDSNDNFNNIRVYDV